MKRILISDKIDEKVLSKFSKKISFDYSPNLTADELIKKIPFYDGLLVRSRTKVTREIIEAGKNLKVIGRAGSGVDNIDVETAKKAGIAVVNAPEGNTNAVVELTFGLIISLLRKLNQAYRSMQEGLWLKKELIGEELSGKTVGIVGYGHIGKKLASLLKHFNVKILYYSRKKKNSTLPNLFKKSDIITLHLPLTAETKNLINQKLLTLMKPTAYLINTSRGGVIEEKALYEALANKKIAGAALDVYWEEPLPQNSPWRKLDNILLTPHIGASTKEALTKTTQIVLEKMIKILIKKLKK